MLPAQKLSRGHCPPLRGQSLPFACGSVPGFQSELGSGSTGWHIGPRGAGVEAQLGSALERCSALSWFRREQSRLSQKTACWGYQPPAQPCTALFSLPGVSAAWKRYHRLLPRLPCADTKPSSASSWFLPPVLGAGGPGGSL